MTEDYATNMKILVKPEYLPNESTPSENEFVFRYVISLTNNGNHGVQLLERYWLIKDVEEKCQEIRGKGVVGKQPYIEPGGVFKYASFVVMETELGTMQGSYQFIGDDQKKFSVDIPLFILANPKKLH